MVHILENIIFFQVKSSDADSGANAEIEYYVSDDHFTVNANGVISNNKKLDADSNNAYYEFIVTAKGNFILISEMAFFSSSGVSNLKDLTNLHIFNILDKGEPPRTGTATVRIYTLNKNDEPPKFSQQVQTIN